MENFSVVSLPESISYGITKRKRTFAYEKIEKLQNGKIASLLKINLNKIVFDEHPVYNEGKTGCKYC